MRWDRELPRGPLAGAAAGLLAVAIVTGAVAIFDGFVPTLSLGALYVFAVLPIAVIWGTAYAVAVAIASMLVFNFLFLPPLHTFTLADRSNWFALAVYLTTAIVVGTLASHARRRRAEAEQREREAALLADIAAGLLRGTPLEDQLVSISGRTAEVLGVSTARIVLGEYPARTRARGAASALRRGPAGRHGVHARERGARASDPETAPAGPCLAAGGRARPGAAGGRGGARPRRCGEATGSRPR